jgi:SAM-dependent methyltransferase
MSMLTPKCCCGPSYDHQYFEALHRTHRDPWNVLSSAYERDKYHATLRALRKLRYRNALELGCSIGGLTQLLANRCEALTAVDTSSAALEQAREQCTAPHVRFLEAHLPDGDWQASYDLVVLSEVLYYFTPAALVHLATRLRECITPYRTDFVVVHWTGETDYPLSGEGATELFRQLMHANCHHRMYEPSYRLETWVASDWTERPSNAVKALGCPAV